MTCPHLIHLPTKIQALEAEKFTCSWERLELIQNSITAYRDLIAQGIEFEPAFQEIKMKQILITILIAVLSASLTANYSLWKQANVMSIEPIELAMVK